MAESTSHLFTMEREDPRDLDGYSEHSESIASREHYQHQLPASSHQTSANESQLSSSLEQPPARAPTTNFIQRNKMLAAQKAA